MGIRTRSITCAIRKLNGDLSNLCDSTLMPIANWDCAVAVGRIVRKPFDVWGYVVARFRAYVSDPGGTIGVMDQERGSCRRLESFTACRFSSVSQDATGDRLRSEKACAHSYHPSVHMYKGLNRSTHRYVPSHDPVNRTHAHARTHRYVPSYA